MDFVGMMQKCECIALRERVRGYLPDPALESVEGTLGPQKVGLCIFDLGTPRWDECGRVMPGTGGGRVHLSQ